MFKLEREHKAGIISGLIASIVFIYFLQPILDWVSVAVVKALTITSTVFLDKIYAQAAHLQTQDFAFLWLLFVSLSFGIMSFIVGIVLLVGRDRLRALIRTSLPKIQNKNSNLVYRTASGALLLLFSISTVVVLSANYIQLKTISSFQQHMRAIAPYIDEREEKMIYSRWSLMKSHADYESIYVTIRSKAMANNIELPENRIYSPSTL